LREERVLERKKAVSDFLEGLTILKDLSSHFFVYDSMSVFRKIKAPLPPNLQGYEGLRHMVRFAVCDYCYI